MSDDSLFISFPPGYLGRQSAKFPLLANDDRFFAVNKPAGVACFRHDWSEGLPDISMALRRELLNQKPQLERLGVQGLFRVYNLDPEVSGALLYAKTPEMEELLKNASGSRQLVYRYHLLAAAETDGRAFVCDLPIARHFQEDRMLVTHSTGKKCETRFTYLRNFGRYQLWEAETRDMRPHQVRLHAAEMGLRIVGESLYAKEPAVLLSNLKRGYVKTGRLEETPLYEGLCLHLLQVDVEAGEPHRFPSVVAPLPKKFEGLLKRLDR